MTIVRSLGLTRRLIREMERHAGSIARLTFFDGAMPFDCEGHSEGHKIKTQDPPAFFMSDVLNDHEPALPEGATYWRLYDNNGDVVLQGDGK